ncbi:amino acid permease [Sporomusa acidovorans]|uniref:Aromatic amino acid transport protein AroP n=1 Tax=Sporomusa acidovorans (strain ATCC 49682 / DSM 3132 / Mol) TaxID=1123286 RepID=A0ABZ3J655_SPOA4|nr:amino acid permease [Sporomusa acidovorans]OZC18510.1 aromatic amino acid transport protein AroP [Sporomusa acidovorans DSM 3132]SDE36919.1 amino acid transporter, AAT family [Sporomusa acidovorans]
MSEKIQHQAYEKEDLKRDLKSRHIQMIAIGGCIGTGLFYGSSWSIKQAGPAIIMMYMIVAVAIYFIMRALGEMAVEEPVSGSYVSYSNRYIHRFVGFLNGWNAFVFLLAGSSAYLNALGKYAQFWFPDLPIWITALAAVTILFIVNVIGVKFYGEAEFWFSFIKVAAIVAMIIFGCAMIFFGIGNGGQAIGFHNLVDNGGFFPKGLSATILSIVMVAFAFGGVENLGLAAGEAKDVKTTMPKAVNATFWRILIFYIGAITVLVTVFPWTSLTSKGSPFVEVFTRMGIPAAAAIMNVVVVTAVLSEINSTVFSNSRTFYNLSLQKNAPTFLGKVNSRNVPANAVMLVFTVMFGGVIMNYLMPEDAFELFSSVTVYGLICAWASIVVSHLKFRKVRIQNGEVDKLTYKMPFYPYSNYFALFFMAVVLICIAILPDMRMSLVVSGVWVFIVYIAYKFYTKNEAKELSVKQDLAKN